MKDERTRPWVIVGGGLAAGRAATTLRKEGFDGRLVVIAAENRPPYERPPLSKDYLRGETLFEKLLAAEAGFWSSPDVELMSGRRATSLELDGRRIGLDDGGTVPFGRLLLATGASPLRPSIPGASLPFVHLLRTVEDSDRIRADASSAASIAVAGGGWISAEVAASLRQLGHDVTLVMPTAEVLQHHLGSEVGAIYSGVHERNGVRLVRGSRVVEVVGDRRGRGLMLSNGDFLRADMVVVGFGATPNVELATTAGLEIDAASGGVAVDAELRTAAPEVFAAGDVASAWHPRYGRRLRVEHWDNARQQGRLAALNMLDRAAPNDRVPYFYSDQFDLGMETFGLPGDAGELTVRRWPGTDRFVAVWLLEGRAVAAVHGNDFDDSKVVGRLVRERLPLDRDRFLDASIPLAELIPAEQPA
jgi:3-phenylpropionate/trans-cinnamate dioxygenase ferredoxin reductase subunit